MNTLTKTLVICPHSKECGNDDCLHAKPHDPIEWTSDVGEIQNCRDNESMCLEFTCKCQEWED